MIELISAQEKQAIIAMYIYHQLSIREVAARTGWSYGTVQRTLRNGGVNRRSRGRAFGWRKGGRG